MVEADTVFEVTDHVFDLGVGGGGRLQLQRGALTVGDEPVVVVIAEQDELGAWVGRWATSAPACQARAKAWPATWSSWRAEPR
jgi:hypothetical protein